MKKEIKQNTGRLFQKDKTTSRAPSFIGKALVGGKEYRVAVWENQASNGKTYLNLDFDESWIWLDS